MNERRFLTDFREEAEAMPGLVLADDDSLMHVTTSGERSRVLSRAEFRDFLRVFNVLDAKYGAKGDGSSDDTAAINNAIYDLNAYGGGVLAFPRPVAYYSTNGGHSIDVPCMVLGEGHGTIGSANGVSTLGLRNGANQDMLHINAKAVTVKHLGLYGNKASQSATSHGIVTSATVPANYFKIEDVWVDSFHDENLNFQSSGSSLQGEIAKVVSNLAGAHGLAVQAGAADINILSLILSQCGLSGGWINAADIAFVLLHTWGNGTLSTSSDCSGILMPSGAPGHCRFTSSYFETNGTPSASGRGAQPRGRGNQFTACEFNGNRGEGVYSFGTTNESYANCQFRDNNKNGAAGAAGAGLRADTTTALAVTAGCQFYDTGGTKKQTYGYAENANTCNANLFDGNVSRAADHLTGNWLVGAGNPTATTLGANVA